MTDGRLPVSKAKSSHYCERKRETLSCYLNTCLAVLTGSSHFKALSIPANPLGGTLELGTFGLFFRSFWAHVLLHPDVYLLPPEIKLLLPISSASCHSSFSFPCLLLLFLPPFVSHAGFHATGCFLASPTYHSSPLPEPGNLSPAHPAYSPFQNSGSKLPYKMPYPSHPSPFLLFHAFYTAHFYTIVPPVLP